MIMWAISILNFCCSDINGKCYLKVWSSLLADLECDSCTPYLQRMVLEQRACVNSIRNHIREAGLSTLNICLPEAQIKRGISSLFDINCSCF